MYICIYNINTHTHTHTYTHTHAHTHAHITHTTQGLEEAKRLLKEAVVLPLYMPDYFQVEGLGFRV